MKVDHAERSIHGGEGGQSRLARFVDHAQTYGPHVIDDFVRRSRNPEIVLDIGAGFGRDLGIVAAAHPEATLHAIEVYPPAVEALAARNVVVHSQDVERETLPFEDESIDLIVANQVLEHTKEVFWIFHEITRTLSVGGALIIGVPNLVSLHNRVLAVAGRHATQHKMVSAHVRPFSRRDLEFFVDVCFPGGYRLDGFRGSQFYPLPSGASRVASRWFPNASFSVFFRFVKTAAYQGQFLEHPSRAQLETNFFVGATLGS
jgi:SAM-dependent methyltransferase